MRMLAGAVVMLAGAVMLTGGVLADALVLAANRPGHPGEVLSFFGAFVGVFGIVVLVSGFLPPRGREGEMREPGAARDDTP
jgi:hypothetical protein